MIVYIITCCAHHHPQQQSKMRTVERACAARMMCLQVEARRLRQALKLHHAPPFTSAPELPIHLVQRRWRRFHRHGKETMRLLTGSESLGQHDWQRQLMQCGPRLMQLPQQFEVSYHFTTFALSCLSIHRSLMLFHKAMLNFVKLHKSSS